MKIALIIFGVLAVVITGFILALFKYPRPQDTTAARIFQGDPTSVDYSSRPELSGDRVKAGDIPKAYTPGSGWETFPQPVLADCTEPLHPGIVDMRGLWEAYTPARLKGHIERIEQGGNRVVVTAAGVIHDFLADGTLKNGVNDIISPKHPLRNWVAIKFNKDGVLEFRPLGGPFIAVTRKLEGDELVWDYPGLGTVRMRRIDRLPERAARRGKRSVESPRKEELG